MSDIEITVEEEADITITIDTTTAYVIEVPGVGAASILTTKGDLLGYSILPERIPLGTNEQVLTVDIAELNGCKWADIPEPETNKIYQLNTSVEVIDTAAGRVVFTIDDDEMITMTRTGQPITISNVQTFLEDNTPLVLMEATGTSTANKGAILWLSSNRGTGAVDVDVFRVDNTDGEIFSIDNAGGIKMTKDMVPLVDDYSELGSSTKTFSDLHLTDENGTYVTVRELAKLHRQYSENSAITPYTLSYEVTGGEWIITITADGGEPDIGFVFNSIVYRTAGSTISVNATSFAGTNLNPKRVYIYIIESGGLPVLTASNTNPDGVVTYHAHTSEYIAGTIGTSDITIYTKIDTVIEMANIADNVYHRAFADGPIYQSGMDVIATTSNLTIGVGSYQIIFELLDTVSKTVGTDGLFYIKDDGTYNTLTGFSFTEYSTGETIGVNKYYNVVFGVCKDDVTRLHAIVQAGNLGSEYVNLSDAISDANNATKTVPKSDLLRGTFIAVARVIVKNDSNDYLQQFPNGEYYVDIRTESAVGGGSAGSTSPLTTKGDIYVYDTAGTRLPVGTNDYILTADSAEATGLKWAAAASGFSDPMTTRGDIIYKNAAGTTTRLGSGTASQVLTSDGTDISWSDSSGGTGDKIEEGNSSVEVIDTGTGYVKTTVDGNEVVRVDPSTLRVGDGLDQSYSGDIFMVNDGGACVFGGRSFSTSALSAPRFEFGRVGGSLTTPASVNEGDRIGALNTLNYAGTGFQYTGGIFFINDGAPSGGVGPTKIAFETGTTNTASRTARLVIRADGCVEPGADDSQDFGSSSKRWTDIYATNATIQTSDERMKRDIVDTTFGLDFIVALTPKTFKWKDYDDEGYKDVEQYDEDGELLGTKKEHYKHEHKHLRKHHGLMAQEVEKVVKGLGKGNTDFAGIIYDKKTDTYGLRYNEFIAPMIKSIQELNDKVERLEKLIADLLEGGK